MTVQLAGMVLVTAATIRQMADAHRGDWRIYERYSANVLRGDLPYASFAMEYPPAALVPLALPRLLLPAGATFLAYKIAFFAFNLVWSALTTIMVYKTALAIRAGAGNEHVRALSAAVACAMLMTASSLILPFRYDVYPLLISTIALLCTIAHRPVAAGLWIGLGIATKIYPGIFLPLAAIYCLREPALGRRAAVKVAVCSALPAAACLVPYVLFQTNAWTNFLHYHALRGLQVESLWAGALMLAHVIGLTQVTIIHSYGAEHVVSRWAPTLLKIQPVVAVASIVIILAVAWHELSFLRSPFERKQSLVRFSLAILLCFMIFNKVLSTQFVVWPIALVALSSMAGLKRLPLLMFLIILLTMVGFPIDYQGLVHLDAVPVVVLNVRNLLLLLMIVLVLWDKRKVSQEDRPFDRPPDSKMRPRSSTK